jgi:transposase, IS5 family
MSINRRGPRRIRVSNAVNRTRSKVRVRVEHVFGDQATAMGGKIVRTIGMARAKVKIGLQNLAHNMRRFVTLADLLQLEAVCGL